jgi:hypothetical protein
VDAQLHRRFLRGGGVCRGGVGGQRAKALRRDQRRACASGQLEKITASKVTFLHSLSPKYICSGVVVFERAIVREAALLPSLHLLSEHLTRTPKRLAVRAESGKASCQIDLSLPDSFEIVNNKLSKSKVALANVQ